MEVRNLHPKFPIESKDSFERCLNPVGQQTELLNRTTWPQICVWPQMAASWCSCLVLHFADPRGRDSNTWLGKGETWRERQFRDQQGPLVLSTGHQTSFWDAEDAPRPVRSRSGQMPWLQAPVANRKADLRVKIQERSLVLREHLMPRAASQGRAGKLLWLPPRVVSQGRTSCCKE